MPAKTGTHHLLPVTELSLHCLHALSTHTGRRHLLEQLAISIIDAYRNQVSFLYVQRRCPFLSTIQQPNLIVIRMCSRHPTRAHSLGIATGVKELGPSISEANRPQPAGEANQIHGGGGGH